MDPNLYKAISEGNIEILMQYNHQLDRQLTPNNNCVLHVAAQFGLLECVREILANCPSLLRWVNVKGDTPLHVAAREAHYDVVQELLEHAKKLNIDDLESGRGGGAALTHVQEMLRATNKDGDTALHMAVRYPPHFGSNVGRIVELLTQEDPEFPYPANDADETPLYLAAEREEFEEVVSIIVINCESPAYFGPGGQTALHAALRHCRAESTNILLNWKPCLTKKADAEGWTPLHYAARLGNNHGVKQILECDKSTAYVIIEKDNGNAALHVAAIWGHVSVMEELLSHCPDYWEILNSEGQNVLHLAVDMERTTVIKFILEKSWHQYLINQKDMKGNTPLCLFVVPLFEPLDNNDNDNNGNDNNDVPSSDYYIAHVRSDNALDDDMFSKLWYHPSANKDIFINNNMTSKERIYLNKDRVEEPLDSFPLQGRNIVRNDRDNIAKWKVARAENIRAEWKVAHALKVRAGWKERVCNANSERICNANSERVCNANSERVRNDHRSREIATDVPQYFNIPKDKGTEGFEAYIIMATLITTITFTAAFTIPGGYNGNLGKEQGMAILVREAAFRAFVIANTIALVCSSTSVFLYLTGSIYYLYSPGRNLKRIQVCRYQISLVLILVAMVALMVAFITGSYAVLAHSLGLAITICTIGCVPLLIYFCELIILLRHQCVAT